ncbi:MAG: NAD(P)-binding domain-containing protein [Thermomicrobium sp.]|nr:NAD(P)-binding domain-containing protein [Thermomicrobium sp.]
MSGVNERPVVVIGAGPIGLVAAAHLAYRRIPFLVFESGDAVGASVRRWSHVRMFSPWRFELDPVAASLLAQHGWEPPAPEQYPTGEELVARWLEPLATHPAIAPALRLHHRVVAVSRSGRDKLAGPDRAGRPFVVRVATPDGEREFLARGVIDASGALPNPLGASGLPALGETAFADRIAYGMPDVLGRVRAEYAGRRVLVVGAGHSAFGVLLDLVALAEQAPGTAIHWAVRRRSLTGRLGSTDDELPERGRLGQRVAEAVGRGAITLHTGVLVDRIEAHAHGLVVRSGDRALPPVDRIVCATGYRPDLAPLRELRLALDPVVEAPVALAPYIDPRYHSCGTVPPHGVAELAHPQEPDFFIVGLKSYGRAPTFLLRTGYEQVRSVVAALAGDWEAARRVELELPATGVCSGTGDSCCESDERPVPARLGSGRAVPVVPPARCDAIAAEVPGDGTCC